MRNRLLLERRIGVIALVWRRVSQETGPQENELFLRLDIWRVDFQVWIWKDFYCYRGTYTAESSYNFRLIQPSMGNFSIFPPFEAIEYVNTSFHVNEKCDYLGIQLFNPDIKCDIDNFSIFFPFSVEHNQSFDIEFHCNLINTWKNFTHSAICLILVRGENIEIINFHVVLMKFPIPYSCPSKHCD